MLCKMPDTFPVTCHTDYVGVGSTFVVIKGFTHDGVQFIPRAIELGATTIVLQQGSVLPQDVEQLIESKGVVVEYVVDARKALAQLSAQAAGYPARNLTIIGITGTKGKTTTSFILKHILEASGHKAALLSTAKNYIDIQQFAAPLTTAQPDYLQQFLKLCVEHNIVYVVMEVAAQAVTMHRVHDIVFDGVIFTNFGLEHLEFYANMHDYFAAKVALLDQVKKDGLILVNGDDEWCASLINNRSDITVYSVENNTDIMIHQIQSRQSLSFSLSRDHKTESFFVPSLVGLFNVYNCASAVSMALNLKVDTDSINKALQSFSGVPGRFEKHNLPNGAQCIIDYAHNPLSYQALLPALRAMTPHLIIIFGAGGGRDASRRPLMGAAAAQYGDVVVLTNDNPRTESPQDIIADIVAGIEKKYHDKIVQELDRERAIKTAYALSKPGTIIALLGKGGDEYQIIGAEKSFFSDAQVVDSLI